MMQDKTEEPFASLNMVSVNYIAVITNIYLKESQ